MRVRCSVETIMIYNLVPCVLAVKPNNLLIEPQPRLNNCENIMSSSPELDSFQSGRSNDNIGNDTYQTSPRGRAIKSCLECRRRKMRCSRSQPCQNCSRFSRTCVYLPYPDWPQSGVADLSSHSRPRSNKSDSPPLRTRTNSREYSVQQTPLTVSCIESDPDRPLLYHGQDTSLRIGKLIITESAGGLFRPQVTRKVDLCCYSRFPHKQSFHNRSRSPY